MARSRDDNDDSVQFDALSAAASSRGKPGPAPRDDSQRALIASGEAKWLKSAIPADLHKQLHVEAIQRDTTASHLVTEALAAFFRPAATGGPTKAKPGDSSRWSPESAPPRASSSSTPFTLPDEK